MTDIRTASPPLSLPDARTARLAIDAVRVLAMDAVQAANSGHPGTPMALAPAGYVLWRRHLRHNPRNPGWPDRDRFVLSCGHASMLQYAMLHLTGYDLTMEDLRDFRQWGSRTPGHPEYGETPGIETTTGPLGQGVANSVGMALAERWLAARFNRPGHDVVDHCTYAFCSDGDLMEGISHEAAAFAGHQRLGKLIWLFDDNHITIDGSTSLATSTDHAARFESYRWQVLHVSDGNDLEALDRAFGTARETSDRPTLIVCRTTIAWGSPHKAGTAEAHGSPLGADEVRLTKEALDYPSQEPFWVADEARAEWARALPRGEALEAEWREGMDGYRRAQPELAEELERYWAGAMPSNWEEVIPDFTQPGKDEATRATSGRVIQALAGAASNLVGGSADLAGSNKTEIKDAESLLAETPAGRNIHFGIREHAMGGILNGMALHGGLQLFGGTFLIFSDYMRPSIRLAALMGAPVRYVFTHDSIGLGEDGPTHQPVEQLPALRAIPNLMDLRPADAAETAEAWRLAFGRTDGPSFLALTRQGVPRLDRDGMPDPSDVRRGGYIFREASTGSPDVVLIASGSELQLALEAARTLDEEGISTRVVSLLSWYLFERQEAAYRDRVLPPDVVARVSIEASATFGWERWVGPSGRSIGIDHFGASAPSARLFQEFGLTAEAVAAAARAAVEARRG
jgi:transketolase